MKVKGTQDMTKILARGTLEARRRCSQMPPLEPWKEKRALDSLFGLMVAGCMQDQSMEPRSLL